MGVGRVPAGYQRLPLSYAGQVALPLTIAHQCGQVFRWRQVAWLDPVSDEIEAEWSLCLANRVILLRHDTVTNALLYRILYPTEKKEHDTESWLRDYFNLDVPLDAWFQEWCARDPIFAKHANRFNGTTILRQDPWECLCAFICSSNNNIPRISQMVHKLCDHFSEPLLSHTYPEGARLCTTFHPTKQDFSDVADKPFTITYRPFPPPTTLAQPDVESKLRALGFGYRAKFLTRTAQTLCEKVQRGSDAKPANINEAVYKHLLSLRSQTYEDARSELMTLPGIGPKVAEYVNMLLTFSCILLMSLDQASSIPVDRHVFNFADRWYHIRSKRYEDVAEKLRAIWGERAGWAHTVRLRLINTRFSFMQIYALSNSTSLSSKTMPPMPNSQASSVHAPPLPCVHSIHVAVLRPPQTRVARCWARRAKVASYTMEAMRQRLLAQQLESQSPSPKQRKDKMEPGASTPTDSNKNRPVIQPWRSEPRVKMMPFKAPTPVGTPEKSSQGSGTSLSTPTKAALMRRGFPASPGWPQTPNKSMSSAFGSPAGSLSGTPLDSKHIPTAEREKQLRDMLEGIVSVAEKVDMNQSRVPGMQCTLLPHQVQGVEWMKKREQGKGKGGILADDMGLGKTIQTLALVLQHRCIDDLYSGQQEEDLDMNDDLVGFTRKSVLRSRTRTTLIVAPVAVMEQWQREALEKSGHKLSVYIHHGPRRTTNVDELKKADIVITSYATAANEYEQYLKATESESSLPSTRANKQLREASANDLDDSDDSDWGMLNDDDISSPSKIKAANNHTKYPLFQMYWLRIVLDEAQNIKNYRAKCSLACYQLSSCAATRWCISGTPVQNNALEIFSLIHFLRISPFDDFRHFEEKIHDPLKSNKQTYVDLGLQRLGVVLKSIMLRRTKDAMYEGRRVLDLPLRSIEIVSREFSSESERDFYRELEDRIQTHWKKSQKAHINYMGALVMLLRLRQACNHPALVTGRTALPLHDLSEPTAEENVQDEDEQLASLLSGLSVKTRNCDRCQISLLEQQARYCSGCKAQISREKKQGINWGTPGTMSTKLEMILNLLDTFDKTSKGDKSIIFSQFTSFLDLVQDALNDCGRNFVRYDGSMRRNAREEALQKIRSDEGIKIILISFKAGSTGLNLTCCNRVILCDLWWNPQIEEQAFDRAHRYVGFLLTQTRSIQKRIYIQVIH